MDNDSAFWKIYGLSCEAHHKKDYKNAYFYIEQLLLEFPDDPKTNYYVKQLLIEFPDNPKSLLLKGFISIRLKEYNLAKKFYRLAQKLSNDQKLISTANESIELIDEELRKISTQTINKSPSQNKKQKIITKLPPLPKGIDYYSPEDFHSYSETSPAKDSNNNVAEADNTQNNPSQKQLTESERSQQLESVTNSEIKSIKQQIKEIQTQLKKPATFPADAYPHLIAEQPLPLLDLPMSKVIDLYHEMPQVLEIYCHRVSLSTETDNILERNDVGNFWVLQLQDQGFCLFPRPTSFGRYKSLTSFRKLFTPTNQTQTDNNQFTIVSPAKLQVLKNGERWLLFESGKILLGEAPLEYQWQQQISQINKEYERFNTLLDSRGNAGLDFTLTVQDWEQSLIKKYGELVTIAINTCMPIAYAIYKGPILVPCQIMAGSNPLVVPGWDRGIPWEASIYATHHSKLNKDYFRTPADHPLFPNQIYLKEINRDINPTGALATWAIAKSYDEASAILRKLIGNWGPLDFSQDNQQDNREW